MSATFYPKLLKCAAVLSTVVVALLFVLPASAQETTTVTDDQVNAIAKQLYCPICESTPLDVCATQACADWREVIRIKLSEGQSEEEIKAYFELQYGARALAEPPKRGFTRWVWILPIVAIVGGGLMLSYYFRQMRSAARTQELVVQAPPGGTVAAGADSEPADEYIARVERELREE